MIEFSKFVFFGLNRDLTEAESGGPLDDKVGQNKHFLINFVTRSDQTKIVIFKKQDFSKNKEMFFAVQLRKSDQNGEYEIQKHLSTDNIWDIYMFFNFQGQKGFYNESCPILSGSATRTSGRSQSLQRESETANSNGGIISEQIKNIEISVGLEPNVGSNDDTKEVSESDQESSELVNKLRSILLKNSESELQMSGDQTDTASNQEENVDLDSIVDSVKTVVESEVKDPRAQIEISAELTNLPEENTQSESIRVQSEGDSKGALQIQRDDAVNEDQLREKESLTEEEEIPEERAGADDSENVEESQERLETMSNEGILKESEDVLRIHQQNLKEIYESSKKSDLNNQNQISNEEKTGAHENMKNAPSSDGETDGEPQKRESQIDESKEKIDINLENAALLEKVNRLIFEFQKNQRERESNAQVGNIIEISTESPENNQTQNNEISYSLNNVINSQIISNLSQDTDNDATTVRNQNRKMDEEHTQPSNTTFSVVEKTLQNNATTQSQTRETIPVETKTGNNTLQYQLDNNIDLSGLSLDIPQAQNQPNQNQVLIETSSETRHQRSETRGQKQASRPSNEPIPPAEVEHNFGNQDLNDLLNSVNKMKTKLNQTSVKISRNHNQIFEDRRDVDQRKELPNSAHVDLPVVKRTQYSVKSRETVKNQQENDGTVNIPSYDIDTKIDRTITSNTIDTQLDRGTKPIENQDVNSVSINKLETEVVTNQSTDVDETPTPQPETNGTTFLTLEEREILIRQQMEERRKKFEKEREAKEAERRKIKEQKARDLLAKLQTQRQTKKDQNQSLLYKGKSNENIEFSLPGPSNSDNLLNQTIKLDGFISEINNSKKPVRDRKNVSNEAASTRVIQNESMANIIDRFRPRKPIATVSETANKGSKETLVTLESAPNTDSMFERSSSINEGFGDGSSGTGNERVDRPARPVGGESTQKPNVVRLPQYKTLDFLNDPNLLQQFYSDLLDLDQDRMNRQKFFIIYVIIKKMIEDYTLKNGIDMNSLSNPRLVAIIITLLDLGRRVSRLM